MASRAPTAGRTRAVPPSKVAAGLLLGLLALAAVIGLAEALRHPHSVEGSVTGGLEDGTDIRTPVECAEPQPREGREREQRATTATLPVEVSSNALYDCPQTYTGVRVRYEGEAVGAVLRRPGGAWVHLNDDAYADVPGPLPAHRDYRGGNAGVGVFVPLDVAADIAHVGGPRTRGDLLVVEGLFHREDPVSGEVAVIRADVAEIVRPGRTLADPVLADRRLVAWIVVAVTAGLSVAVRVVTRRERDAGTAR